VTVLAVRKRSNAALIADCAELGYIGGQVLDPTYGKGGMWKDFQPTSLTTSDLHCSTGESDDGGVEVWAHDFTDLPWGEEQFDTVVFDPPYKLNGTSTGKGPAASDERYGVTQYQSVAQKYELIKAGMWECSRVLRFGGFLLVKCQDQVCSGKVQWQTRILADYGELELELSLTDMLHVEGMRAQPPGRRQLHARRNYSTMLVFRKP